MREISLCNVVSSRLRRSSVEESCGGKEDVDEDVCLPRLAGWFEENNNDDDDGLVLVLVAKN